MLHLLEKYIGLLVSSFEMVNLAYGRDKYLVVAQQLSIFCHSAA